MKDNNRNPGSVSHGAELQDQAARIKAHIRVMLLRLAEAQSKRASRPK